MEKHYTYLFAFNFNLSIYFLSVFFFSKRLFSRSLRKREENVPLKNIRGNTTEYFNL